MLRPSLPTNTDALLGAVLLISLIAYLAYAVLTATADALEWQIDQAAVARGTVEAP